MNLGRVVGRVVSTLKDPSLTGSKILMIRPVGPDLKERGPILMAADASGAGAGEIVIYVRGREAAHAFLPDHVATDAGVIGIVDDVNVEEPGPRPRAVEDER